MAKAKLIPVFTSTTGLNTYLDPTRIAYDLKTGETELSQAVNVDIDDSGRVGRRLGRTQKRAEAARDGFASGDVCLFVSGTTLYQMDTGYDVTALRTDLTAKARMSYVLIAGRIYYINNFQKGYVVNGSDNSWSKGSYTGTQGTKKTYSDPPLGHLVSWFAGRALVAKQNTIFPSEPSFYGAFDLHNARPVPDRITMMHPTSSGLWVGTERQILFYRGRRWKELRREVKADYGVLEGSAAKCLGVKLGTDQDAVLFTTPEGICAGGEDGSFTNVTYRKLQFPEGRYASATVIGGRYVVLIEA